MPFVPHTEEDVVAMLQELGEPQTEQLFDEIPQNLRYKAGLNIPEGFSELDANRYFRNSAKQNAAAQALNFIGAGAYEHHIPAAVWELASRGEFMTAYTPYQAEASQGSLQLIYEFQTMIASLTGMDAANASLYDGATALAEAVLKAVRVQRKIKTKRILIPETAHPNYRETVEAIVKQQGIELVTLPMNSQTGLIDQDKLDSFASEAFVALVLPFPNFMGCLEHVDELTNWAHDHGALVIAVVNPMALGLLKSPGDWGTNRENENQRQGADIVCGELQPFGMPLASGGPYAGFMCCKQDLVRQMPGRIVGKTQDIDGKVGYVLTLQAREQHIRRSKATSNICTNQGLLVTAATIYMSLLGPDGIKNTALKSHQNMLELIKALGQLNIKPKFSGACFHECVFELPCEAKVMIEKMAEQNILAGYDLSESYAGLADGKQNLLLVCTTETKTLEDMALYCGAMQRALG